jgi:hypothetical protein
MPSRIPTSPPSVESTADSMRNWIMMLFG